ncbi:MAG: right-handed parallel beta-helix repeat-containing protein [Kofleriaceae bacterium]
MRGAAWALLVAVGACAYQRPPLVLDEDAGGADGTVDVPVDGPMACAVDAACASGICADGVCASAASVSYVAVTGDDGGPCTLAAPCATVARALTRQAELRQDPLRVVVEPGSHGPQRIALGVDRAEVVGRTGGDRGPPRIRALDAVVATVDGGQLELRSLTVAVDAEDLATAEPLPVLVRCDGGAARLTLRDVDLAGQAATDDLVQLNGCAGVIDRSQLHDTGGFCVKVTGGAVAVRSAQLRGCGDGGLQTQGATEVAVTGTIVAGNGRPNGTFGGVGLDVAGPLVFTGNTVASNFSTSESRRALNCTASSRQAALPNNLVTEDVFKTTCRLTHSVVAGIAVIDTDPSNRVLGSIDAARYVDAPGGDFHILPASPAVGAGVVQAGLDPGLDVDGTPRPQGPLDVGADELP